MQSTLLFAVIGILISSLPLTIVATKRMKAELSLMAVSILLLSILYNIVWGMCALRVNGVLPERDDFLNVKVLMEVATGITDQTTINFIIYLCAAGFSIINVLVALAVYKTGIDHHPWKWTGRTLAAAVLLLAIISIAISIMGGLSFYMVFFDLCCGIMAAGAYALGLTYKEFCVIGNIYVQGLILVLSALSIFFTMVKNVRKKQSTLRIAMLIVSAVYASLYVIGFVLICRHYAMPLEEAFNLCVQELKSFGQSFYGVGYIGANIIIFVVGWIFLLILNVLINMFLNKQLISK